MIEGAAVSTPNEHAPGEDFCLGFPGTRSRGGCGFFPCFSLVGACFARALLNVSPGALLNELTSGALLNELTSGDLLNEPVVIC